MLPEGPKMDKLVVDKDKYEEPVKILKYNVKMVK